MPAVKCCISFALVLQCAAWIHLESCRKDLFLLLLILFFCLTFFFFLKKRYISGIEYELCAGASGDIVKLSRFLYVDYYLEFLEQYKGTSELSNEAFIGVRGVRATHLDNLKVFEKRKMIDF